MKYYTNTSLVALQNLERIAGKTFMIGGIITNVRKGISKRGSEYAFITFEDYRDTFELGLFDTDYHKFKHLLEKDLMLHFTGRVEVRKRKNADGDEFINYRVSIDRIMMMSEVMSNLSNGVELRMQLADLDDHVIDDLREILIAHSGQKPIKLIFLDAYEKNNLALELNSYVYKVELTHDLLEKFKLIKPLDVRLN